MDKDIIYDEYKQIGIDYRAQDKADIYDEEMNSFRNYEDEVLDFIKKINLSDPSQYSVLDIGCGTGAFTISASKYFKKVIAADVSDAMLNVQKKKAKDIKNIEFINQGFLNLPEDLNVDIVHTKWALHHLPDFWKQFALIKINRNLKRNGILFLSDLVFRDHSDLSEIVNEFLPERSKYMDETLMDEVRTHIKDEYSTFNWILEGMLHRAGFEIGSKFKISPYETQYICKKKS